MKHRSNNQPTSSPDKQSALVCFRGFNNKANIFSTNMGDSLGRLFF